MNVESVRTPASEKGSEILSHFEPYLPHFKKVMPNDFKKMQNLIAKMEERGMNSEQAQIEAFYALKQG